MTPNEGRFVWRELMTTDLAVASKFYAELFGWTYRDLSMGAGSYRMVLAGEEDIGGIVPIDGEGPEGAGSHWIPYAAVADVDARTAAAQAQGGSVRVPPTSIGDVGRFSTLSDPQGAGFSLFQSNDPAGTVTEPTRAPGTFCWTELMTSDPDAAAAFYGDLFGWTFAEMEMPGGIVYRLCRRGQTDVAGIMVLPPEASGAPPHWLSYVAVEDAGASTARVSELGGRVYHGPQDIPDVGRFSVVADPTGGALGIITLVEKD